MKFDTSINELLEGCSSKKGKRMKQTSSNKKSGPDKITVDPNSIAKGAEFGMGRASKAFGPDKKNRKKERRSFKQDLKNKY